MVKAQYEGTKVVLQEDRDNAMEVQEQVESNRTSKGNDETTAQGVRDMDTEGCSK